MTKKLDVNVTVILPTLNEEEGVADTIDAIPKKFCKKLEILIVDGNSSDKTREIALGLNFLSDISAAANLY